LFKKKRLLLIFVLLFVMFSQFSLVNVKINGIRWPMNPFPYYNTEYVYYVVNDSYVDQVKEIPEINIRGFSHKVLTGRIILTLMNPPKIKPNYEYRMIVFWDTRVRLEYNLSWPDLDWENVIPSQTNFTLCVAGGASWLGVTNGSYSAYYNSNDDLIFNESKSNSIIKVDNGLEFVIKQDYIPDRYYAETVQVFTSYNATSTDVNATTTELYLDGLPSNLIVVLLDCAVTYYASDPTVPGFTLISGLFIFVLVVVRKYKKK